ncbi:nuclease [Sphingobium sp. AP49]|uniref:hypothetical protein n=1 Tax=Sphingobium sp. AP49 TaxID=1144307 RepID=UPI00026EDF30|nr:hypothetical protein [Sphingobium sp. AP49]WHO39635.1 nuclease [Sphingobium sp. AP49]
MAQSLYEMGDQSPGRKDAWLNDMDERRTGILPLRMLLVALLLGAVLLLTVRNVLPGGDASAAQPAIDAPTTISTRFAACDEMDGQACILSADSYAYQGRRYHLADISAPHVEGARCPAEADQARRGRTALQAMLNGGPFEARADTADTDPGARLLMRDGVSLGQLMILKGYARPWSNTPLDWCTGG